MYSRILCLLLAGCLGLSIPLQQAWSAPSAPSVANALKLKPVQGEVPFDSPSDAELKDCTIRAEKQRGVTAWVIRGPNGDILRSFPDSNGDNVVDTWSYFRDGLEIYRDIDTDFNGKVDQSRWFHGTGSRWGVDRDEDGTLDAWRSISAEEVAEEAVAAVRTRNAARFQRLLLAGSDLKKLGLSKGQAKQLAARIKAASGQFKSLTSDKRLEKDSEFTDFGGLKPGVVPAGTQGSKKDLLVYENAWAMVRNGQDHVQLQLGTMIRVGDAWKLIDDPVLGDSQKRTTGFFFNAEGAGAAALATTNSTQPSEKMQEILTALEKIDQQLAQAKASQYPALNGKRAELLVQLAKSASTTEEREQWIMQLADMISAAAQGGGFPGGAKRLKQLEGELDELDVSSDVTAHVQFRRLQAEFGAKLSDPDADYAKVQAEWIEQLEVYVQANAKSGHLSEALLQLAMYSEFASKAKDAEKWYRRIAEDFPKSANAAKARGAVRRFTCKGRTINLSGSTVRGGKADLKQYRGKVVVVQYWNVSSPTCKADHAIIKELYAKYGGRGLAILGVNLDYTRDEPLGYLKENRLPWKQLYETGGFESRLANEMGIITLPLMLLVDRQGKVVSHDIQAAELEGAIKKLLAAKK